MCTELANHKEQQNASSHRKFIRISYKNTIQDTEPLKHTNTHTTSASGLWYIDSNSEWV